MSALCGCSLSSVYVSKLCYGLWLVYGVSPLASAGRFKRDVEVQVHW